MTFLRCLWLGLSCLGAVDSALAADSDPAPAGTLPVGSDGQPLNTDLETGTLAGWLAEGDAFNDQPVEGDTVSPRRGDMRSDHAGRYWIGTYERAGDPPQGTLTSAAFQITHPWASFRVAGGPHPETCVELVRSDTGEAIFTVSGHETENLEPVAIDLSAHQGKEIFIRLVDHHSGHWGHINFDDFRFHDTRPAFPRRAEAPAQVYAYAGLSGDEAAAAMTVPEGFHVSLFAAEPDVQQPIAMALDDRGRLWVAEAYSYPVRVPEEEARDRILIFEDADGDGRHDRRTVFCEGLNLVSGLEVGFGGVWVGAAPNLLFIPDRDRDDVPDGAPEVVLDGWGYEDTHETLNSFIWGPDGWLYGCHGVFTHSRVGSPGTPDEDRVPLNAGIWRFHPTRRTFEVFAHGTSNPWGVDFDDRGQAFATACVIPHLFHIVQGGRYERQAGEHFNPHTYDDIKTIADHRHYTGNQWRDADRAASDDLGGGHAHAGAMIYLGGAWPAEYRGAIFMSNIHGARVNMDLLRPEGSGFIGSHGPDFIRTHDLWSQMLYLRYGPDGNVYIIDWYDQNQCHRGEPQVHDRTNGRVFKVSYGQTGPVAVDLAAQSDTELAAWQTSDNDWHCRHARRLLQERAAAGAIDPGAVEQLARMVEEGADEPRQLRALWALHAGGGLDDARVERLLDWDRTSEYVRAWTVQLALEDGHTSPDCLTAIAKLAYYDRSPIVRLYIASAAQRLSQEERKPLVARLAAHERDADDHNLPLMYWYALEPLAAADPQWALETTLPAKIPQLLSYTVRRVASLEGPSGLEAALGALAQVDDLERQRLILNAIRTALAGRRQVPMPEAWAKVSHLLDSDDGAVREAALALAVTFGDRTALGLMRATLANPQADAGLRAAALETLLAAKDPELPTTLLALLAEPALRAAAIRGLALYDERRAPEAIVTIYAELDPAERRDALATLSSRVPYAAALLDAVGEGRVAPAELSADVLRQLTNLGDERIDARIAEVWGTVRETAEDKRQLMAQYQELLAREPPAPVDLSLGRAVFAKTCQKCHTLFGVGGKVGPDITGSNRANLEYLLSNILDPSAVMAKEYQPHVIQTTDGRVITGIARTLGENAYTVLTATETITLPRDEIDEMELAPKSMMPDDILKPLADAEVRALVAYVGGTGQVPLAATPDNVAGFFNGRDLEGWQGKAELWSVEEGQIVGRSPGLDHNEFLASDLAAGDFRLSLQVRLVDNRGNSGIQFRSEPLPGGEVRGYQADVGAGWWGKLYEEHGRGLLWDRSGEEHVRTGEWNDYVVEAQGDRVRTWINGQLCVDLADPPGRRHGIAALQLHAGEAMEVRFRELKLELLEP
jgi:putative membrane-bound dehydrogenase-like protein